MKLSTRGRYATRALLDLALHHDEEPVLLKDIARRQQISLSYLEHLIAPLIAGGIVRSMRGAKGGMSLAKPADEIRLDEVIRLLEGSTAPSECVANPETCSRSGTCAARDLWVEVKDAINGVLGSITLKELVERQQSKKQSRTTMYHI